MTPHRYTELFFLDEAAALSAGHRPCAECRREDYRRFQSLWRACHGGPADADSMDARLHEERLIVKRKRTYREQIENLPDGTYVVLDGAAWLLSSAGVHAWSDSGYTRRQQRRARGDLEVLTPRSIVAILAAGYRPGIHPTAVPVSS